MDRLLSSHLTEKGPHLRYIQVPISKCEGVNNQNKLFCVRNMLLLLSYSVNHLSTLTFLVGPLEGG